MENFDLLITGAQVVTMAGVFPRSIAIKDGVIKGLLAPDVQVPAQETWDFPGKIILPGGIDTHAHVSSREGFASGTATAAKAGFTTLLEMGSSNLMPNNDNLDAFQARLVKIKEEALVDIALWAALYPQTIDRIDELIAAGCIGFKVFMNYVGEKYPFFDDYHLLKAMEKVADVGGVIALHAENESLTRELTKIFREEGRDPSDFPHSRPVIAEMEAISRACLFAKETGCRIHICHVSNPRGMEIIEKARADGVQVTAETCPHYLASTAEDLLKFGPFAKCAPPLRSAEDVEGLWGYVKEGRIDTIGTDHSAYPEGTKDKPFWEAPSGGPGLDVALPALIDQGIHGRDLSWTQLAQITSTNAARIFNLPGKGQIEIGYDADLTVIDPQREWTFSYLDTFYPHKSTKFPDEGRRYKGYVYATIVRGQLVYQEGRLLASGGHGRFLRPGG